MLVATLLFAACASVPAPNAASYAVPEERQKAVEDFTAYLREKMAATGMVAGAIFADGGSVLATSGIADSENPEIPLNEETIFGLASLSKMHVLLLAKDLHESGVVDLNTPVRELVPELHEDYSRTTLRDLLCHKTGLPREHVSWCMWWDVPACWLFGADITRTYASVPGMIETLNKPRCRENLQNPRERYSNLGIGLLGIAFERATGESVPELVRKRVCEPLALSGTTFSPTEFPPSRYAGVHAGDIPKLSFRGSKMPLHILGDGFRATGGIFSTPADELKIMRRFREFFASDESIGKLSAADNGRIIYGFEFHTGAHGERMLYRHGMTYGSSTFVCFGLDSGVSIFVFYNNCDWPRDDALEFFYFAESLEKRDDGAQKK